MTPGSGLTRGDLTRRGLLRRIGPSINHILYPLLMAALQGQDSGDDLHAIWGGSKKLYREKIRPDGGQDGAGGNSQEVQFRAE